MRRHAMRRIKSQARQNGMVLVISLILLLIMTLLAIASMQDSTLQERMAGNAHDQQSAFQSAEAALRAGERYLQGSVIGPFNNTNGLYDSSLAPLDWRNAASWIADTSITQTVQSPQYLIELLPADAQESETLEAAVTVPDTRLYRITARGFGLTTDSVVTLQSIYRR